MLGGEKEIGRDGSDELVELLISSNIEPVHAPYTQCLLQLLSQLCREDAVEQKSLVRTRVHINTTALDVPTPNVPRLLVVRQ